MKTYVIDTSALVRLYVPDGPLPEGLEAAVEQSWKAEAALFAPEVALAEMAQVLWKKESAGHLGRNETDSILAAAMELPVEYVSHYRLVKDALSLARQYGLTVYDALFLAAAQQKVAELITADDRLSTAFSLM